MNEKNSQKLVKNTIKIVVALILVLILSFIGTIAYVMRTLCDNSVVDETDSPTGKFKAVYFIRDCGATTSFVDVVSVLPKDKEFTDSNRFIAVVATYAENVQLQWLNDKKLLIKMECKEVFRRKTKINGIEILYQIQTIEK